MKVTIVMLSKGIVFLITGVRCELNAQHSTISIINLVL